MSKLIRVVAIAMVCLLPVSIMQAEIQGAMLYAKGMVTVNGVVARTTSAPIKTGDTLQTAQDGTAQIVAEGAFVQVQPASAITYTRSSITLQQGLATISAKDVTGSVSSLRVSPLTPSGVRFTLRNEGGRVQVAALMGNVAIRGNNNLNVTLKTGEVYTLDGTNNPGTQPDPQGGNGGRLGSLSGSDMGLIFAISAAIIAGVTVGVINATSVSPAGP